MSARNGGSRDGSTRVRFGGIGKLSTERGTDPAAGTDRFVNLEALELLPDGFNPLPTRELPHSRTARGGCLGTVSGVDLRVGESLFWF